MRKILISLATLAIVYSFCSAGGDDQKSSSDSFPLEPVAVQPFSGKYRLRVLVGVREENPKEVVFIYSSEVRSNIGLGGMKFRVPQEYGGDVIVTIPRLSSMGSACFLFKNDGSTGRWLLDRQRSHAGGELEAEIVGLAIKE